MNLPGGVNSIIGRNLKLSDKYTRLLPIYPGSRIFSVIEGKDQGKDNITVSIRIRDDIDKIIKWHRQEVERMGYSIKDWSTTDEVTNIWFYNDQYTGSITISNKDHSNPGKTTEEVRVSLWLETK